MRAASILRRKKSSQGSVLLAVVFASLILTVISIALVDWGVNSFKQTVRKQVVNQATNTAHNEMEYLFYVWSKNVDNTSHLTIDQQLQNNGLGVGGKSVAVTEATITTAAGEAPFLTQTFFAASDDSPPSGDSDHNLTIDLGAAAADTHGSLVITRSLTSTPVRANGILRDGTLERSASVGYYDAKVRVVLKDPSMFQTPDSATTNSYELRIGRRFVFQKVSPVQNAVFYQGNLELSPGTDMDIAGDIQSNQDVYLGSQTGAQIRVSGDVYFHGMYNGSADPMAGTQLKYGSYVSSSMQAPIFSRNLNVVDLPDQTAARQDQVHYNPNQDYFVTKDSPDAIYGRYSTSSNSPYQSINDIYRSIIAPPPKDAYGNLVPEDATVKANRMYNKASVRIAIGTDDAGNSTVEAYSADGSNITGSIRDAVTAVHTKIYDPREDKYVYVSDVDVSKLKSAIESDTNLSNAYNGVVYIYDKNTSQPTNGTDASAGYAVKLINAEEVPNLRNQGFTVASDNAVYVKGDFNTRVNHEDVDFSDSARAAILGDAFTVLSTGWDDKNATPDSQLYPKDPDPDTGAVTPVRVASGNSTINAAIVSGNTPTTNTQKSGGVQNLVRYMENWVGLKSSVNGSIAQMYESKYFNSTYRGNVSVKDAGAGTFYYVYVQPKRFLMFDRRLAADPPSGMPSSKKRYYRGDLYAW